MCLQEKTVDGTGGCEIHLCFSPVNKHVWIQWGWLVSALVAEGIPSSCISTTEASSATICRATLFELLLASLTEGMVLSTGGRKGAHTAHPDTHVGAELQPCKPPFLHCALGVKGKLLPFQISSISLSMVL